MRKNTKALFSWLSLACLLGWHAPSAHDQLLVYEGYDYDADTTFPNPTDGTLNGGIGWAGGWTTGQFIGDEAPDFGDPNPNALPNPSQAIVDGLNYTDSKGNRLQTSGRAHDLYANWNTSIANVLRDFDTSPTGPADTAGLLNPDGVLGKLGTTLWMSILLEGRDEESRRQASFFEFKDTLGGTNRSLHIGRPFGLKLDGTVGLITTPSENNEAYGIMRKKDGLIRLDPDDAVPQYVGTGVDAGSGADRYCTSAF